MAARAWRGTLIYIGAAAAMAAAGISRFAGVPPQSAIPVATSGTASTGAQNPSAGSAAPTPAATSGTGSTGAQNPSAGSAAPSTAAPGAGSSGAASTATGSGTTSDTVTIVGSVSQTRYGPVQVSVTFTGSQITNVQALQSPSRERRSAEISQESLPALAQEVVAAQSARIDTVSGATYTSQGYRDSVQSAIDQRG